MFKMPKFFLMLFFCLFLISPVFASENVKIGIFNFEVFLKNSKAGQKARQELSEEARKLETQIESKKEEIEKLRESLIREAIVLSEEAKSSRERDLQIKALDLRNMEQKFTRNFNQQQNELLGRIQTEVKDLIKEIGKKEGYLLILENVGVVYSPDHVNITDRLIKEHDAKYRK